jgi:DNA repair photolyase
VDFESRLFVKPDAAKLLHAALSRPGYDVAPIALGTNTDPLPADRGRFGSPARSSNC